MLAAAPRAATMQPFAAGRPPAAMKGRPWQTASRSRTTRARSPTGLAGGLKQVAAQGTSPRRRRVQTGRSCSPGTGTATSTPRRTGTAGGTSGREQRLVDGLHGQGPGLLQGRRATHEHDAGRSRTRRSRTTCSARPAGEQAGHRCRHLVGPARAVEGRRRLRGRQEAQQPLRQHGRGRRPT